MAHALHGLNLGFFTLVPRFVRDLDETRALAGFIGGLAFGAGILMRPLAGPMLDRLGRRWTLWAGGLLAIAGASLYPGLTEVGFTMYAARVLSGIADGLLFAAFFTYAADVVPRHRRVQGLAVFGISGLLSMSFAPAIGEWLINHHDYRGLWMTMVGTTVASFLVTLLLPEPTDTGQEPDPVPARRTGGRRLQFAMLALYACAFGLALGCAQNFIAPAADEATVAVGFFTITYGLTAAAVRLGGSRLPDMIGAAGIAGPALGVYGVGLMTLGLGFTPTTMIAAGVLGGIGHGFGFPAMVALGTRYAPGGKRGTVMAWITGFMDLFLFAPAWPLGRLADRSNFETMFVTGGVLAIVAAIAWVCRYVIRLVYDGSNA